MKRNKSQEITRNIIIMDLMEQTGWSRKRVVKTLNFMEIDKTLCFSDTGALRISEVI